MSIGGFKEEGQAVHPGSIILWSGTVSNMPVGWAICDGNNGTPDLRGRHLRGGTSPGNTGGQDSITLDSSQLPSHDHSTSIGTSGAHKHQRDGMEVNSGGGRGVGGSEQRDNTSQDGSHSHSLTTNSTGGNSSIESHPAYREVGYIMKL